MKFETTKLPLESCNEMYGEMLEAFYEDLLLKEKAGRISPETYGALDTFLDELRTLVAETQEKLPKAA